MTHARSESWWPIPATRFDGCETGCGCRARTCQRLQGGRVAQGAPIAAGTAACLNLLVYFVARAAGVTFTGRFNPAAPETVVALKDVLEASA